MYLDSAKKAFNSMINLKKNKDYIDTDLDQLIKLTSYPGIWELKFKDTLFKMINITKLSEILMNSGKCARILIENLTEF